MIFSWFRINKDVGHREVPRLLSNNKRVIHAFQIMVG